ncbi:MAG: peptide-methionine (R)-S-oxide reductase MsrB [Pseudomonadota bacterium]
MKRRQFILTAGAAAAAGIVGVSQTSLSWSSDRKKDRKAMTLDELHEGWRDYLPAGFEPLDPSERVQLSKEEWQVKLNNPLAYDVLRREGTERPFTSELNNEKREGVYVCAGCPLPVFTSAMKFDSGTGWPSFFTSIPGALETKTDYKLILPRTEYHCVCCGGHHGHVFKDGPAPTGQRWCNNGVSLIFLPKDESVS